MKVHDRSMTYVTHSNYRQIAKTNHFISWAYVCWGGGVVLSYVYIMEETLPVKVKCIKSLAIIMYIIYSQPPWQQLSICPIASQQQCSYITHSHLRQGCSSQTAGHM